jgi:Fic family protein
LAHLYFESLHPFDDGNGRVGRALAEKALAQDLAAPVLFSLSAAIERGRKQYYDALGQASGYTLEVTPWLHYFISTVYQAQQHAETTLRFVLAKAKFFTDHTAPLNDRQKKALERMFAAGPGGFEGGMSAAKYQNLTKTSKPTATRDLSDLLDKGYLRRQGGGGRSTGYGLNLGYTPTKDPETPDP